MVTPSETFIVLLSAVLLLQTSLFPVLITFWDLNKYEGGSKRVTVG